MSDTDTSEVEAAQQRVNELRDSLAEAERSKVAALRAQDEANALEALEKEEAVLKAAIADINDAADASPEPPPPVGPEPSVPPVDDPTPPAVDLYSPFAGGN